MSDSATPENDPFPVEVLAVPFIIGMAVGIAFGRVAFQSTFVGFAIGVALFGLLAIVRVRLLPVRSQ